MTFSVRAAQSDLRCYNYILKLYFFKMFFLYLFRIDFREPQGVLYQIRRYHGSHGYERPDNAAIKVSLHIYYYYC